MLDPYSTLSPPYPIDSSHLPPPFCRPLAAPPPPSLSSSSPSFPTLARRGSPQKTPSNPIPASILGPLPALPFPSPPSSSPANPNLPSPARNSPSSQTPNPSPLEAPSWSSKVKSSLRTLRKINPPTTQNRKFHTHIPDSVCSEANDRFNSCILVQFYGRTPPVGKISNLANIRGKLSPVKVFKVDNGDLIFRLNSKSARDTILSKPLWYLGNLPLFLSEWKPGYRPDKPSLVRAPIWVIFKGLPFELLTRTGLSYLASVIGDPLYPDKATDELSRLDQARVCIEVSILEPLPDSISVSFDNGTEIQVNVEYPWRPPVCDSCGAIGHPIAYCPSTTRTWKPKSSHPQAPQIPPLPPPHSESLNPAQRPPQNSSTPSATQNSFAGLPTANSSSPPETTLISSLPPLASTSHSESPLSSTSPSTIDLQPPSPTPPVPASSSVPSSSPPSASPPTSENPPSKLGIAPPFKTLPTLILPLLGLPVSPLSKQLTSSTDL